MKEDFRIALWMAAPVLLVSGVAFLGGIYAERASILSALVRRISVPLGVSICAIVLGFLVTSFFYDRSVTPDDADPRSLNGKSFLKRATAGVLYGIGITIVAFVGITWNVEAAHRGEAFLPLTYYAVVAVVPVVLFYVAWAFIPKKRQYP